jgi:hypothetical protein
VLGGLCAERTAIVAPSPWDDPAEFAKLVDRAEALIPNLEAILLGIETGLVELDRMEP